jgi:hypothetical protein
MDSPTDSLVKDIDELIKMASSGACPAKPFNSKPMIRDCPNTASGEKPSRFKDFKQMREQLFLTGQYAF